MATGVLIIGVGRATRLLTYVIGSDKAYSATIRLGQSTVTDDADGDVVSTASVAGVTSSAIAEGLARQTGAILQVPSAVSAIKIDGKRAYKMVREGLAVELPARSVTVSALNISDIRYLSSPAVVDVDVSVTCSSGTYIRAIARDLGTYLGVGGHLTALRRTAVGGFDLSTAVTLPALEALVSAGVSPISLTLEASAERLLVRRDATVDETRTLSHGGPLSPIGVESPYGVFSPSGQVIAIVSEREGKARAEVVFAPAS